MDIHIDIDTIKFFIALLVSGIGYGWYCYKRGLKVGWDDAMYELERSGYLYIDEEGEVRRYNDKEYRDIIRESEY
jgi:hypothetical protein